MNSTVSPFLSLFDIIRGLRVGVAAWGGRGWLATVLVLLVHRRMGGILGRMERLVARFQAGRLWRIESRAGVVPASGHVGGVRRARGVSIWPRRFGWLVRMAGWEAAGFGSQLRAVLETPEMVALLAASPQAGRVLRPMCRMLAIETQVLRPGVVPGERAVVEKAPRVRKRREKLDFGRVPLPRGVISSARRAGVWKG